MPRAPRAVQVPGVAQAQPEGDDTNRGPTGADGEPGHPDDDYDDEGPVAGDMPTQGDDERELSPFERKLLARIEAVESDNKALRAAAAARTSIGPAIVTEPVTVHGAAAIAASKHRHLTSAEFVELIDSGKAKELPFGQSVLCSDGYYVSRLGEPRRD
jgi:hypothetical protein